VLGAAVRHVYDRDGVALKRAGVDFNVSMLFGGQIQGEGMRLFQVYSAGNFIEATSETPFFQIGESKYGKPVLDRVLHPELPLDLAVYEAGSLRCDKVVCIDEHNPYFQMLRSNWGERLRAAFDSIEDPQWFGGNSTVPLVMDKPGAVKKITTPEEKLI